MSQLYSRSIKRSIDVIIAIMVLLVAWPIWIVLAVIVKLQSSGPVLYRQERTGKNGVPFTMYKFRTTTADNDVRDVSRQNVYTRIGVFMRRYSLDELPQVINILRGDMSIIGPRPWIHEYWQAMNRHQQRRTMVRPGVTGLAQVHGRNRLSILQKIDYDLRYISQLGIRTDLYVLAMSIKNIFETEAASIDKFGIHSEIQLLKEHNAIGAKPFTDTTSLVSIVVPVHNAARYIASTIRSVKTQTYTNWELILVDDGSTDNSALRIKKYQEADKRIRLYQHKENRGAGIARNTGVQYARGRYIAFLDADDTWHKKKLSRQIDFMNRRQSAFCYTGYLFAKLDGGTSRKKVVSVPPTITYEQALKNTTIFTSTVMLDMTQLAKADIEMPNVLRGQDTATWWKILRIVGHAHGFNEALSTYRRSNTSLSANKFTALKRTWNLYRNIESLSILKSLYNFAWYSGNAIRRRV